MPSNPNNCSGCGAKIAISGEREEAFQNCPVCGAPIYLIPPPLAACILLNERREVLLTKRSEPEGETAWSLPMGFAQVGEAVTEAATRIMKETAGLECGILRLIDADAATLGRRTDLTAVTFEMERAVGSEQAGAGVERLGYFPHSRHPDLICAANERALQLCAESHLEEWMISDSFERLQNDADRAMLSDELVRLIRDESARITQAWLEEVGRNQTTRAYAKLDQNLLRERVSGMLSQFGRWLIGGTADREVADFYFDVGRDRRRQGFGAHEVLSALMLLKKHVWLFAHDRGVWKRPIDAYRVLELNRRIVVFFDKAMYHAARGLEPTDSA